MKNQFNSIGLTKKPSETTVVVAMSGGVDSSTVAGMMKKDGYKVIGITLKLYDDNKELNSIGLNKKPSDTKVVVAMSGGVDSSTVAGMMKKEGYEVIGITLKLYDDAKQVAESKQCCSGQDIMDAKRVAQKIDIEHKILYYQNKFKQGVIDNFVDSYLKGETPIPVSYTHLTLPTMDSG